MITTLGMTLFVPFCAAQVLQDHTQHEAPPPSNETKINTKTAKRGPRALGVVEFLPGGKARLVPIALWIDGRYYDASLYAANPAPMALEPETVYEATDYGEPTGLFTVETSSEFGINVRHCEERHLYLFGIGEDEAGAKGFTTASMRAFRTAKHAAEDFQAAVTTYATREDVTMSRHEVEQTAKRVVRHAEPSDA